LQHGLVCPSCAWELLKLIIELESGTTRTYNASHFVDAPGGDAMLHLDRSRRAEVLEISQY